MSEELKLKIKESRIKSIDIVRRSIDARYSDIRFSLGSQNCQHGGVAAVIQDHIGRATVMPFHDFVCERPVLIQGFALEGEDRNAGIRNGGGGMVLG